MTAPEIVLCLRAQHLFALRKIAAVEERCIEVTLGQIASPYLRRPFRV